MNDLYVEICRLSNLQEQTPRHAGCVEEIEEEEESLIAHSLVPTLSLSC